ncbi:MAG: NAD(P)-binding protein, partial [Actinomycetota bacterium]
MTEQRSIDADYVVVGAGAMGMAFVDEILTHSDADVVMIDEHGAPGGHWNDAYPFVRLHQPSFFYGVSSTRLGSDRIDDVGLNAGLSELA